MISSMLGDPDHIFLPKARKHAGLVEIFSLSKSLPYINSPIGDKPIKCSLIIRENGVIVFFEVLGLVKVFEQLKLVLCFIFSDCAVGSAWDLINLGLGSPLCASKKVKKQS